MRINVPPVGLEPTLTALEEPCAIQLHHRGVFLLTANFANNPKVALRVFAAIFLRLDVMGVKVSLPALPFLALIPNIGYPL